MSVLLVAVGAALGAPLRYAAGHFLDRDHGGLPWGTILVNVAGSFLLGLCTGLALSGATYALLGTGFSGALTTLSAFAVQSHDRGRLVGSLNVGLTVLPAFLLCAAGFWLGQG